MNFLKHPYLYRHTYVCIYFNCVDLNYDKYNKATQQSLGDQ